jgi:hypothetical protein
VLEQDFITRGVVLKVMPPWTFHELREARGLYPDVPEDKLSCLFDMWGGDATRVLEEANTSFPGGASPDLSAVRHAMRTCSTWPGNAASVSLHLIPDAELNFSHYDLPSLHVAELVVKSAYASTDTVTELKKLLNSLSTEELFKGVLRSLWHALVLRSFKEGAIVQYLDLQNPKELGPSSQPLQEYEEFKSLREVENKPGVIWRPSKECQTTLDLVRLPDEICLVALHVGEGLDKQALEKEIAELETSGSSAGRKPWLTWFVPPEEFSDLKDKLLRQKAGKKRKRGERKTSPVRERVATFL